MGQFGGQPIFVLSEDAMRQTGRDAQSNNIAACKAIGSAVRTTLGPRGMDKMMVDSVGDVIVTNDGVTILDEMEVEHPAAKMMVEVAKTQDEEVGDGTTTAVVIAGELLKKAENLLEQEIHPTVIASGYRLAREKAIEALHETGQPVSFDDQEQLGKVAMTAMTGKSAEANKKALSQIAVDAVRQVAEQKDDELDVDLDMIKLEKKQGGSVQNTNLIQGVALDKEKVHSSMPSKIDDAKIALLDVPVEIKETETDAEISITDPNQLQQFIEQEENTLKQMVEQIKAAGANVVLCQKGIDDVAQHFMAKEGIFAVRRVKQSDMAKLANATGGTVVTSLKDLDSSDLGSAGIVEQRKVAGDNMVFVRECQNPKAVTVLVRGGTEHVVDEIERSMDDAIGGVVSALRLGKVVGGGGAPEVEVAKKLREYADAVEGREQLAITAFAEALEVLPRTLAENAGLDPIDMLVEMRNAHDRGEQWAGVNVFTGHVEDLNSKGVVEPLQIKTQAIGSASESAEMILRIDDVISSSGGQEGADAGGGGMPPGAMGM